MNLAKTIPRSTCRRRMPPVELGLLVDMAGVPVVLARISDPRVVRGAIEHALQAASEGSGGLNIAERQQLRFLQRLLDQVRPTIL